MEEFTYIVQDPLGIHARPAGLLAKLAKGFGDTVVTVTKNGREAKASQLMKLMSLAVKSGDSVQVRAEGANEKDAIAAMKRFFEENL